jgi:hypothetical protein
MTPEQAQQAASAARRLWLGEAESLLPADDIRVEAFVVGGDQVAGRLPHQCSRCLSPFGVQLPNVGHFSRYGEQSAGGCALDEVICEETVEPYGLPIDVLVSRQLDYLPGQLLRVVEYGYFEIRHALEVSAGSTRATCPEGGFYGSRGADQA